MSYSYVSHIIITIVVIAFSNLIFVTNNNLIITVIDFVFSSDYISMLDIGYIILEPIYQIVLANGTCCPRQGIADAHDLRILSIIYSIATANGHDLTAAFRNGFLQNFRDFLHILFLVCLLQFLYSFRI